MIGTIELADKETYTIRFDYDVVKFGNGIDKVDIKWSPENVPIAHTVEIGGPMTIDYATEKHNVDRTWLSGAHSLLLSEDTLWLYKCGLTHYDAARCTLEGNLKVKPNQAYTP